ncbi:MAG: hypothetical protein WKF70_09515 [Chitinophagaceae bacterium]
MKKCCSFLIFFFISTQTFDQAVGDKVEAYSVGNWYRATVKVIGIGEHLRQCLIDYDEYTTDRWHNAKDVRL